MTDEQREAARQRQREERRARARFTTMPRSTQPGETDGPRAAEQENNAENAERREDARPEGANAEEPAQTQAEQSSEQSTQTPEGGNQQQQQNAGGPFVGTGPNGNRAWFFQGTIPIVRNWPIQWPDFTRIFRTTSGSDSPATPEADTATPEPSASSDSSHPTTAQYPSAAAHTLPTHTPPAMSAESSSPPRTFEISNDRREQLVQQQQQSREQQREQDQLRRQEESEQDRDIGGRGVTQDFTDWVRRFGGMDPD